MKYFKRFLLLALLSAPVWARAQRAGDQGYGLMIGNPTGLSGKLWLDDIWAIDGAVGIDSSDFDVHLTVLMHNFNWVKNINNKWGWFDRLTQDGDLPFYFGAGPRILFDDENEIGIRIPVGLSYFPHQSPWEIFTEFAPVLRFTPSVGFNGDFALGVRYYFQAIRPRIEGNK